RRPGGEDAGGTEQERGHREGDSEEPGLRERLQVVVLRVLDPERPAPGLERGVGVFEAPEALANPGTRGGQPQRPAPGVEAERRASQATQAVVARRRREGADERG